ncbi:unnamed protein product [Arabidopsis arenosa]|uniref:MYB transcription factor n=1 Tax=Arabidopsis arenosa TaxID=38785 RepID=A0A8S1ZRH4_ARAAE|nr:unnamed protein product [Arabidopsis arenosa]
MDSEDSSSDANAASGEKNSSMDMDSADNPSDANIVGFGDDPSSAAMDTSDANVTYEYTLSLDDMVLEALSTIDEEHDGSGRDVDGIFEFNNVRRISFPLSISICFQERYVIPENVRELLKDELEKLVAERKIEKVGNRYKMMPQRVPTTAATREDSTMLQESPSTSLVPRAPEENPQVEAVAKVVAEAENYEFQAKEAQELVDRHSQMLDLERLFLELAVEILNRCANGQKIFLRDDPSSMAMDPGDSLSDANDVTYGNLPPAASSSSSSSSDPSAENLPYADQLERAMIDTEDDRGPSGFTTDELIYQALETVYPDGNGLDIDGIFNFIEERNELQEDFRDRLEVQLGNLVSEGQVEMVGNLYKIPHGLFDTQLVSVVASNLPQTMSPEDSTSAKPQDTPSTCASFAPAATEEDPRIEAVAREVAEAEHLEFEAKEAEELADRHVQLLNLESNIILELAVEILNRCANGEQIYLLKSFTFDFKLSSLTQLKLQRFGNIYFTMRLMASNIILFEDIFVVDKLDPDGKKFDKVTRVQATSHNLEMFMHLDVNTEVYPLAVGDKFTLALAPTLNLDGTPDTGYFTPGAKKTLADKYEYIMYGKLYKISERDGKTPKAELYVSFGGLLMLLKGDPAHISHFELDQRLFLLMRKLFRVNTEGEFDFERERTTKCLEMLGHRKNKWTVEEEEALLAGIAKHGSGKWSNIVDDPEFAAQLLDRTNINLKVEIWVFNVGLMLSCLLFLRNVKDKWRNMKKSRTHTLESNSIFTSPSKTSRAVVSNDTRYAAMVFEAISTINDENGSNLKEILSFVEEQHEEVPQNFKRLLSYSLRILVSQDKLKKVRNRYKISVTKEMKPTLTLCPKDSTKPTELPSTSVILTTSKETREIDAAANRVAERINELAKENDDWYEERQDFRMFLSECLTILVSQGKLEKVLLDGYKISELENKVMEVAPEVVAMKLAESDNKRLIAAEAVEEEERMHKFLEESHTMLQLCLEIHQQCALGEEVFLW